MKNKVGIAIAIPLAASLVFATSFAPVAHAAQTAEEVNASVATLDRLTTLVGDQVSATYSTVSGVMEDVVADTVKAAIGNPEAVKATLAPVVKSLVKSQLSAYSISNAQVDELVDSAIDYVLGHSVIDDILTNEFVQAVLDRAVDYAVADIVAQLGIDSDAESVRNSLVNQIWNAPLRTVGTASTKVKADITPTYVLGVGVNTSYYNYNINAWNKRKVLFANVNDTPKEITVTGWNTTTINVLVSGSAGLNVAGNIGTYQNRLKNIDYTSVFLNALQRALVDEIRARAEALVLQLKTELADELTESLAGIGVEVTLDPAGSLCDMALDVRQALRGKATAEFDNLTSSFTSRTIDWDDPAESLRLIGRDFNRSMIAKIPQLIQRILSSNRGR
jgi:hypothetical protein